MKPHKGTFFFVLFLPFSFLFGLLLAPFVFNGLIWAGRNIDFLFQLRNVEFERVVSRVVVVACITGFLAVYWLLSKQGRFSLGWKREKGYLRCLFQSLALGFIAVLAVYLAGFSMGVFEWKPYSTGFILGRLAAYIPGVILISWIEESLFRGILFKGLSRSVSWTSAAWISSILYSLVHFAKPDSPVATVYGHWYSGFALIPHTFAVPGGMAHIFPYALMLTLLGLSFALATHRTGTLYAAAGLHAGVILGLKVPSFMFKPAEGSETGFDWFGMASSVDKSYAAFLGSVILLLWVFWRFRGKVDDDSTQSIKT